MRGNGPGEKESRNPPVAVQQMVSDRDDGEHSPESGEAVGQKKNKQRERRLVDSVNKN